MDSREVEKMSDKESEVGSPFGLLRAVNSLRSRAEARLSPVVLTPIGSPALWKASLGAVETQMFRTLEEAVIDLERISR